MKLHPTLDDTCACGTRLTGRHCLSCGSSQRPQKEINGTHADVLARPHNKSEPEDGQALMSVLSHFNLTLPRDAISWRVVRDPDGEPFPRGAHSVMGTVRALITNGVVCWFAFSDDSVFFGHLSNFLRDEPKRAERPPRKRKEKVLLMLED